MKQWYKAKFKNLFFNLGYFLKEVKIMIQLNMLFHALSIISIGLVFFILSMVMCGWWTSSQVVEVIQKEAEINVYYDENIGNNVEQFVSKIRDIDGVLEARVVDKDEAYNRMKEILGKEARVLEYLDDNPFSPFIEVKISIDKTEGILKEISQVNGIEYVRDNRDVLDKISNIANTLRILGYLVLVTVGISTLVIISHIIRLGIHNNREHINTLRLLGAPESFIAFPFLLEGLVLILTGGMFGVGLSTLTIKYVYNQVTQSLSFIQLIPYKALVTNIVILIMSLSLGIGVIGSILGFSSATKVEIMRVLKVRKENV